MPMTATLLMLERVRKTKALLHRIEEAPRRALVQRATVDGWADLSSEDRVILYPLVDRLSEEIHGMGPKGATELLMALGLWMLEQNGTCQNSGVSI